MSNFTKITLLAVLCLTTLTVSGASWFVRGNKYNIDTVIVTGNFKSPRLIAELIQAESRQPYVIVPSSNSKQNYWYLALPKTKGYAMSEDKFASWIKFSQCRRVIILGDTNCVPEKYAAMIDKSIPVVRIVGDWNRVAEELTYLLNLSSLKRSYPKLRPQLDRYYQPISAPAAPAAPAAKNEKAVEPVQNEPAALPAAEKAGK